MVSNSVSEEHPVLLTAVTVAETLRNAPGLAQQVSDKSLSLVICSGLDQIVRTCRQKAPCILVMDSSLLTNTELAEFARATDLDQSITVLIVTDQDDPRFCQKLVTLGFAGSIQRSAPPAVFRRALEVVAKGELWASRTTTSAIIRQLLSEARPLGLTNREREILGLVARGYKNQEVADILFVSRETIRWHLRSMYSKLGVPDRKRAIEYALTKGMITAAKPSVAERVGIAQRRQASS